MHMHGDRVWGSVGPRMLDDFRNEARKHREPDQRHIDREEFSVRRMARGEWRSRPWQNFCGGARGCHDRLDSCARTLVYLNLCCGAKRVRLHLTGLLDPQWGGVLHYVIRRSP
jgi:hypothetical protein